MFINTGAPNYSYFILFWSKIMSRVYLLRKPQLKALSFKLLGYFYTKIFQCTPLDFNSHFLMKPSKTEKNDIHMNLILMHRYTSFSL